MSSIKDLIAAQKAVVESAEPKEFEIGVGGERVAVGITRLRPDEWANLAAAHPPRAGSVDAGVGYNQETLPAAYPAAKITVAGEPIDAETWRDLYGVIEPVHKTTVGNVIWGVNVYEGIKEFRALGKAAAGKPSDSPASKESHHADSVGGNPQSSPHTTTPTGE